MESYIELFDFENNNIISNKTQDLFGYSTLNMKPNLLKISKERNIYIFSTIADIDNIHCAINIKFNLEFKSGKLSLSNCTENKIEYIFGNIVSCFVTEKDEILICFYGYDNFSTVSYLFIAYNKMFEELKRENFIPLGLNNNVFFYSIFFRENAGAFLYYKNESNIFYPIIFKQYDVEDNSFKDYFLNNNLIFLNDYIFHTNYLVNDLVKISDYKLAFFTCSVNVETLYIVIFNIFNVNNMNNIKIRYYSIEAYKLLNYRISEDIKGFIFNDFIIIGTSYCLKNNCTNFD